MSVVVEASGVQVLPDVNAQRATVNPWQAMCAADADQRTKSTAHRDLAARLFVKAGA